MEKEKIKECEDIIKSKKQHFQREIEGHEDDLMEINDEIAKLGYKINL